VKSTAPIPHRYFTYGILGLIVYASLYPFDFQFNNLAHALRSNWLAVILDAHSGIVDMVANVCLYFPLGFILCAQRRPGRALAPRIVAYALAGAALAASMEILQFAVPTRQPSVIDIELNTLGTLVGALAALGLARALPAIGGWQWLRTPQPDRVAYLLIGSWLALKGVPFIPRLDSYRISQSLTSLRGAIESFAVWLTVLTAVRLAFKREWFWRAVLALIGYTVLAQLLFRQHSLKLDDLFGGVAAIVLIGATRQQRTDTTMPMVFACIQLSIVFAGLAPYRFTDIGKSFIWVPFGGSLDSSYQSAPFALLLKLLLYGGCLWSARRASFSRKLSTMLVLMTVSIIEAAQLRLPGRVAEITDPLMVLALALFMSIPALGVALNSSRELRDELYR
jgi:VanZ family protein